MEVISTFLLRIHVEKASQEANKEVDEGPSSSVLELSMEKRLSFVDSCAPFTFTLNHFALRLYCSIRSFTKSKRHDRPYISISVM